MGAHTDPGAGLHTRSGERPPVTQRPGCSGERLGALQRIVGEREGPGERDAGIPETLGRRTRSVCWSIC